MIKITTESTAGTATKSTQVAKAQGARRQSDTQPSRNEVTLCGRLAAAADERELPSGDTLLTVRIIVDRDAAARSHSAQRVDTIDCVAWCARVQRVMRTWEPGDVVLVEGSIRRRFFRAETGAVSRVEVEVERAKRMTT